MDQLSDNVGEGKDRSYLRWLWVGFIWTQEQSRTEPGLDWLSQDPCLTFFEAPHGQFAPPSNDIKCKVQQVQ